MKNKNLIWGLFFILAGVAVILDRTGLLGSDKRVERCDLTAPRSMLSVTERQTP